MYCTTLNYLSVTTMLTSIVDLTFGPRPAPPCSYTSFCIFFSSNVSTLFMLFHPLALLNNLNKMWQGRKRLVTQYYDTIRAFKLKLSLWKTQLSGDDTAHFLCLKSVRATGPNSDLNQYKEKMTELLREFKQRFRFLANLRRTFKSFARHSQ